MPADRPAPSTPPFALRLAGCWLLWVAWCSLSGWGLSSVNELSGKGHLCLLPLLLATIWLWLKVTSSAYRPFGTFVKWRRRMSQPLPLIYVAIAGLSLFAGLSNSKPWSYDAATYRLPRLLYWWTAHHWYWIGTLDHRLDFSSTGFEWQMLPVIELTHSVRCLFLLNWIPFLLFPWLVFLAFRALGVNGRSARRWMWLLPSGYCFALQCSGLQNDGYSVNYLLAAVAFAAYAFRSHRAEGLWFAILAAGLLTGAKVSNLPLMLPLGAVLLPLFKRVPWVDWRLIAACMVALMSSCAPMAFLSWQYTGDWTGDPGDQWNVKTRGPVGGMPANLILLVRDATQPPILPSSQRINAVLQGFNHSHFVKWLAQSHKEFEGIQYGEMVYEGSAGPGFGLAIYIVCLLFGLCFVHPTALSRSTILSSLPWAWRLAPWLAWVAYAVFIIKLGSSGSARTAAPYYSMLIIPLLRSQRIEALERKRVFGVLAGCAAATVIPIIILTPARPLFPMQTLARLTHSSAMAEIAGQYQVWDNMRDDLAPLREKLPTGVSRLGYAGGFHDTPYGLWKPLGGRVIVELGLPPELHAPLPPPDLEYAVVTARGLLERYNLGLTEWLAATHSQIIYEYPRNLALESHSKPTYESWYLVKLNASASSPVNAPNESVR